MAPTHQLTPAAFAWDGVGARLSHEQKKALLDALHRVADRYTGVRWRVTSWIRDSPGHQDGDSLDIAPDMQAGRADGSYAVTRRSDPVLHMRPLILGAALTLSSARWPGLGQLAAIVALENDHLHIQLVIPKMPTDAGRIIAFQYGKDMTHRYPDSLSRQRRASKLQLR